MARFINCAINVAANTRINAHLYLLTSGINHFQPNVLCAAEGDFFRIKSLTLFPFSLSSISSLTNPIFESELIASYFCMPNVLYKIVRLFRLQGNHQMQGVLEL